MNELPKSWIEGATPNGATVWVETPDGSRQNVTVGVQALYDLVLSSMDWGSEFWDLEDALPVGIVARLCGFEEIKEVDRYIARAEKRERERKGRRYRQFEKQSL